MPFTLVQAHAMVMIISFMTFGSTGIFMARYGRSIRFGSYKQLLGKAVWFQIHRFLLSISALLILVGFLIILSRAGGQWVNPDVKGVRLFVHSILGGIIVCCVTTQIWLTLYRCSPNGRFRFVFVWIHRIIGLLAFILCIPTIFIVISVMTRNTATLQIIFSIWTFWLVVFIAVCEQIEHKRHIIVLSMANNTQVGDGNQQNTNRNMQPDIEAGTHNVNITSRCHNQVKLLLLLMHIIISIILSVSFIVILQK